MNLYIQPFQFVTVIKFRLNEIVYVHSFRLWFNQSHDRRINTVKSRGRKLYSEEFHNKYYHDKQTKDESSWLEHVSAIREKRNT